VWLVWGLLLAVVLAMASDVHRRKARKPHNPLRNRHLRRFSPYPGGDRADASANPKHHSGHKGRMFDEARETSCPRIAKPDPG